MKLAEHLRAGLDPVQLARLTGMECRRSWPCTCPARWSCC